MRVNLIIYNLNVDYFPGKYLYVADLLCRNFKQRSERTDETLQDIVHIIEIVKLKTNNNKESELKKK